MYKFNFLLLYFYCNVLCLVAEDAGKTRNLVKNGDFEKIDAGQIMNWHGNSKNPFIASKAYQGKWAAGIELAWWNNCAWIVSETFVIYSGKKYFLNFWIKKPQGLRFIPFVEVWEKNAYQARKKLTLSQVMFPLKSRLAAYEKFENIFGMIEVPDDKPYQEGKILFYCDWKIDYMIEGKRYNEKKIVIDSVSLNLVN